MRKNNHHIEPICGRFVTLREVTIADAAFVSELRTTGKGAKFLHSTESGVAVQEAYIRNYLTLDYEWYFVIEGTDGVRLGLISLYDVLGDTVRKGRWVMREDVDRRCGIESDVLVKQYAFDVLGCLAVKTDTRHCNKNMQSFYKAWGCVEERRDEEEIYYTLSKADFIAHRPEIERFYAEVPAAEKSRDVRTDDGNAAGKYLETFAAALEISREEAVAARYGDIPTWDSVGHIGLSADLETAFGVKFSAAELAQFKSFDDGKALLRGKGISF